jgi:hypothetical protein
MIARQKAWMKKVTSLMDYMHYPWDTDPKWKTYQEAKQKKVTDLKDYKREEEQLKRGYYNSQVDKEFEKNFEFDND